VDKSTRRSLSRLLSLAGLPPGSLEELLASGEGVALLANLVNWQAKVDNEGWYDYKPALVDIAVRNAINTWVADGVAYVETPVGQVSFHIWEEDDHFDPMRSGGGEWSGEPTQEYAVELLREFLSM